MWCWILKNVLSDNQLPDISIYMYISVTDFRNVISIVVFFFMLKYTSALYHLSDFSLGTFKKWNIAWPPISALISHVENYVVYFAMSACIIINVDVLSRNLVCNLTHFKWVFVCNVVQLCVINWKRWIVEAVNQKTTLTQLLEVSLI